MNYIRREGKRILNHKGQPFLLKGVGLGGWLLPEGYMWHFPEEGDRPRRIEDFIKRHLGEAYSNHFWREYKSSFISEKDIKLIKSQGYNSIRLPFNSRHIMDDADLSESEMHFIDQVIAWCEENELYVILDMHGAPGGQTGTNIDDSKNNQPELFTTKKYQLEAVEIWRKLAERYSNNPWIAGYDLLNEPLPEWFSEYNHMVVPLYKDMINAIRSVDQNHMIILEGVHWSTDLSIFDDLLDDNVLLQFHKYWNNPDVESVQQFLDLRQEMNVPIFMGEGGENNLSWYTGAFHLYDSLDISWNFWTYKKMDNTNSLISVEKPGDWSLLCDYLMGKLPINKNTMEKVLDRFLENIKYDRCHYNQSVMNAMFRMAPVKIPAIFYDYGGKGVSYESSRNPEHEIGFRNKDEISLHMISNESNQVRFNHGGGDEWDEKNRTAVQIRSGDWIKYSFRTKEKSIYRICLVMMTESNVNIVLETKKDKKTISELTLNKYQKVVTMLMCEDQDTLKIKVLNGVLNIESIEIDTEKCM